MSADMDNDDVSTEAIGRIMDELNDVTLDALTDALIARRAAIESHAGWELIAERLGGMGVLAGRYRWTKDGGMVFK